MPRIVTTGPGCVNIMMSSVTAQTTATKVAAADPRPKGERQKRGGRGMLSEGSSMTCEGLAVTTTPCDHFHRTRQTYAWAHQTTSEIDVVAFALDSDEQVSCDEDFVFYGATESPGETITLSADGPAEQSITIDTAALPPAVHKVIIAAATTERTILLAEVYRRGPSWRLRAIGQGYDHGLGELARGYGVDIDN
jgi:stress response protein SCP2